MKHLTSLLIVPILLIASFVITSFNGATPRAYAACPPIAGYPTFGFDVGRTSYNPSECIISPAAAPPFNWASPFGVSTAPREGIATDTVKGYIAAGNAMVAFSLATGAPIWGFPAAGPIVGAATVYLGNIYFGDQAGNVYALNPGGGLICSVGLGTSISTTPIALQNIVIVSAGNGRLYGIDANTCAVLWVSPVLGKLSSPTLYANFVVVSVQVTATQSAVYALNALTGAVLGSSPLITGLFTPPAVMLRQIYVGTDNPAASVINFVLSPPALPINWIATTGGSPVYGKPAVDNNMLVATPFQVYAVAASGKLFAFNAGTGLLNWAAGPACGVLYKAAAPTVANGGVYVGGTSCMNAFKTLGGATWSIGVGTIVDSPATVVNGTLLFTASIGATERIFSF